MKKSYIYITLFISLLGLASCDVESEASFLEDGEDLGFTGTEDDIIDFLTEDAYQGLLDLGITVNTGNTPPEVEGTYLMSPFTLKATNIPGDGYETGDVFLDKLISLFGQDNESLKIEYSGSQIDSDGNSVSTETGVESYITGSGNNFTIIVKTSGTSPGSSGPVTFINGIAISGSIGQNGIIDAEYGLIIIEKNDDVNDEYIDEGEGRLFEDLDGLSNRQ
ncbi:hypothetical protein [Marixanthomonas spongiae]|uniref:DUF5689 domain-containing protein n=1 Tax=Marixanthomonas spongiae TaxID=2174845 RepID=A0A2U0I0B5_9FLAO|nr:hypothetical protein [Marixanthomonas spongiae]PVW14539.1 hypothetical protein DDV96_08385 [Marixanthomonas spongiae]